ncbi:MAG: GldM family protein [Lacibacter sp.]
MRYSMISFILFFIFLSANCQSTTVSTFEKQTIYVNVNNPLNISSFNISPANIKVETNNGTITRENGMFYWKPEKEMINAFLFVSDKQEEAIVDTFKFIAKQVGIPAITWKERIRHFGTPDWNRITKLYLDMPICCNHLKLDTLCKILSFDILITYPKSKKSMLLHCNTDSISKEFKALVPTLKPGVKIEFTKIKIYAAWNNPSIFFYDDYFKYIQTLSFTVF